MTERLSRRDFLGRSALLGAGTIVGIEAPHVEAEKVPSRLLQGRVRPMTLREKVAQLFVVSFVGTTLDYDTLALLDRHALGGVTLYANNCASAAQVRKLLTQLQVTARYPMLVSIDQEGGRVTRLRKGLQTFPAEAWYGKLNSTQRVYQDAAVTARELRAIGLSMNLAPVVDVVTNPKSPIGQRSYGSDPRLTARLSVAAIQAYQQHGLAATAKHFVGLGHTSIDAHRGLPTVTLSLQQFEQSDFIGFRAAIAAGVSSLMVTHVALPAIDPVYRPASLSPVVIQEVIRKRLGFTGVIITDSLMMGALPKGQEPQAAEQAFLAGADVLLMATDGKIAPAIIDEAVERVTRLVVSGQVAESRLEQSLTRILAVKTRYPAVNQL